MRSHPINAMISNSWAWKIHGKSLQTKNNHYQINFMKTKKENILVAFVFAASAMLMPGQEAQAYLDPGTGSYILQIVIASIAAVFVGMRVFWSHIKNFIFGFFLKKKPVKTDNSIEKS